MPKLKRKNSNNNSMFFNDKSNENSFDSSSSFKKKLNYSNIVRELNANKFLEESEKKIINVKISNNNSIGKIANDEIKKDFENLKFNINNNVVNNNENNNNENYENNENINNKDLVTVLTEKIKENEQILLNEGNKINKIESTLTTVQSQ